MLKSAYTSTTALLGTIASATALFNFATQYFKIGLNGVFASFISFYQKMFFPIIDYLASHANWMIPDWNKNLIVLMAALIAINAKSTAQSFAHKLAAEATSEEVLGEGSVWAQVMVGLHMTFAHFSGAAEISGAGRRLSAISTGTITAVVFLLFVSFGIFTPYVRNVIAIFVGISIIIFIFSLGSKNTGDFFLNRKVFALHYLGAILGAVVFYILNSVL